MFYIDFHCHPAMKPYGQSFRKKPKENSTNRRDKNSIWYYDPPTVVDKLLNYAGTLTKFRQSDFSTLSYGNARVVCISLYPLEKPFANTHLAGDGGVSDLMTDLATGLGPDRIDYIQKMNDYYQDLKDEYNFYVEGTKDIYNLEGEKAKFQIVSSYDEIFTNQL